MVYHDSHFPDLPVTAYGGELFAPGSRAADVPQASADGLAQALAVFETACFEGECCNDQDVHILRLLTRTTMRIPQGRDTTSAEVPVDFSDLFSEYIGILYEGRRAAPARFRSPRCGFSPKRCTPRCNSTAALKRTATAPSSTCWAPTRM